MYAKSKPILITVTRGEEKVQKFVQSILPNEGIFQDLVCIPSNSEIKGGCLTNFFASLTVKSNRNEPLKSTAPDISFHADSYINLTHGITAYKLIEPLGVSDDILDTLPVIVLLHGFSNSSYMWEDLIKRLNNNDNDNNGLFSRFLVFDFYGRGRSPWTGVPITLDVLVMQTKELINALGLSNSSLFFIGYDIGGSVASGFSIKFPEYCHSLILIGTTGLNYKTLWDRKLLKLKYIGEYLLRRWNPNAEYRLHMQQELEYFNRKADSSHRNKIDKQISMFKWQTNNTNGFWGSLLSSYRFFPLEGMENIFINLGRHYRPVLIIWGKEDKICSASDCAKKMEDYFPNGNLIDVIDCGHNAISEKFDEVSFEIYSFLNELIDDKPVIQEEREDILIKIEKFSLIKPGVLYEGSPNKKKIFNVNPGSTFQSPSKI